MRTQSLGPSTDRAQPWRAEWRRARMWRAFMKLEMRIGEAESTVTATPCDTEGRYQIDLGEETWEGEIFVREGHGIVLMAPEGPMEAWVARSNEGLWTWCDGRARLVQVGSAGRGRRRGAGARVAREVTPPMPAVVMSLLVEKGDLVTKGQGLVVVSAMKMEMTLAAPFDGTVVAIRTEVGAKVNPGEILVDIAPAEPEKGEASEGGEAREKVKA